MVQSFLNQHNHRTERKTKVVLIENRSIFLLCKDLLRFYPFAGIIIVSEFPALSIFRANIETNINSTREQCLQLGTYSLYLSGKIKNEKKNVTDLPTLYKLFCMRHVRNLIICRVSHVRKLRNSHVGNSQLVYHLLTKESTLELPSVVDARL